MKSTPIEINDTAAAAQAAQFCAQAKTTIRLAQELPRLGGETYRMLRAQSLGHCLNMLASTAHFCDGPSVEHLRAYVIDWQASDQMCRDGDGLPDFCAELLALHNQMDAALGAFEDARSYAPQPRGMVGSGAP